MKLIITATGAAAAVAAASISALAATGGSGHHSTSLASNSRTVAATQKIKRGLLREFTTVGNKGYFYTAYPPEAAAAVKRFHFHPTGRTFGFVDSARAKGTVPLYRLHLVGRQSYLVTADVKERNRLLGSHRFTQDGILGYIPVKSAKGLTPVWRLGWIGHPGYWRLATTAQEKQLIRHGWHLDGLVGFTFAKA